MFVVNYHWIRYDNVSFIEHDIYESFALNYPHDFDLVFIGPKGDKKHFVMNNGLPERGYYSYHSMRIILDTFTPEEGYKYAGYFLVNDDSCLQPTFLSREDHRKAMRESTFPWIINKKWIWNYRKNLNNDDFRNLRVSLVDLYSLCLSDHFLGIQSSSYSRIASILCNFQSISFIPSKSKIMESLPKNATLYDCLLSNQTIIIYYFILTHSFFI